ncbi:hypothetical protein D3Z46_06185 [Bacteroides sartorii]|nr:hypothetical protein [Phocaeicola sartorii]
MVILLSGSCQDKEYIQLPEGEVPVEVVMTARAAAIGSTANEGREGIKSIRIVVFKHNALVMPGIPSWSCEFNGRIDNNGNGTWNVPGSDPGDPLTYENGAFQLGKLVTTGEKKIYVIANEDCYYSSGKFTTVRDLSSFIETAETTTADLLNASYTDSPVLMSGGISTIVTAQEFDGSEIFQSTIELVRTCAKIDADIIRAEGYAAEWIVSEVTMTSCANKVALFQGMTVGSSSYFEDDGKQKSYNLYTGDGDVPAHDASALSLFSEKYVYENIVTSRDNATRITVTLTKKNGNGVSKTVTIYIGNEEVSVSEASTTTSTSAVTDYSIYRNYHYQLHIKLKEAVGARAHSVSGDVDVDVTITRTAE